MTADAARALAERLRHPRYEVLPLDGIEAAVLAHVPKDVTVTVTASPSRGLDATLGVGELLAREGYAVVPHISARLVRDAAHLAEVLARLRAAGVREIFAPAGDAPEPAGEFSGAAALLAAMAERRADFPAIGITGYPESHHVITDEATISAMFEKAEMATYIVSQICFDAGVTAGWIAAVRARGTGLPIWIGVPGVVDHAKLLRISMRIGLGESTALPSPPARMGPAPPGPPVPARRARAGPRPDRRGSARERRRLSLLHVQRGAADGALAAAGARAPRPPGRSVGVAGLHLVAHIPRRPRDLERCRGAWYITPRPVAPELAGRLSGCG